MRRAAGPLAVAVVLILGWACDPSPISGPASSPDPAAEPSPTEAPRAAGCPLPKMPDHGHCRYEAMLFYAQFEQALDEVIAMHPEVFDLEDTLGCDRCYYIKDGHAFYRHFIDRLERMGFCAQCDEECGIKNTNAFNEQYDVIVWQGYIRRGIGSYRGTCYPAAF